MLDKSLPMYVSKELDIEQSCSKLLPDLAMRAPPDVSAPPSPPLSHLAEASDSNPHSHSLSLVLVVMMKSNELKTSRSILMLII